MDLYIPLFVSIIAMEKQLEDLRQQLDKQCLINQELQRQNKDLGVYNNNFYHINVPVVVL